MKKIIGSFATFAVLVASIALVRPAHAQLGMLHVNGLNIVDANNNVVQLRGVNLGDWLVIEPWMCPGVSASDAIGSYQDEHSILSTLDSRFGVANEQSLINTYQSAYITTADLQNIKAQGLNLIRVPVWWGDFYTLGSGPGGTGGWRSDAFTKLDWVVSQAASLGIYTIIDMHGAIGQQSNDHSTGWQNQNQYWSNSSDQQATNQMWTNIATHYAGNANVAGYDILNEPDNAPSDSAVISAYVGIMNTIRAADPNHICFIEGTFDQWNWSMLPSPSSEGWTNVVYEMHQYNGSGSGDYFAAKGQVTDWQNHWSWNVPDYIGEFNPAQNSTDPSTGLSYWQDVVNLYSSNGINWSVWTYKAGGTATQGGNWNNNWGLYQPNPNITIPTPSLASDSFATIQSDWAGLTTANEFVLNSNISNAVVGSNPSAPAAPTNLSVSAGNAQATLAWNASAGAATYNVYRGTSAGGEGSTPIATGLTGTSYSNTGLTNGTTYYYKVGAVNGAGTSGMSNEVSVTPSAPVEAPYGGAPAAIPGTVQAENYDTGGQALAYNVTSTNGSANSYRSDGVDLESCSDTGGYDLGWTSAGQWFNYTVNVVVAGTYTVGCRVSSGASGGTFHIQNASGTNLSGTITVPGTGGWQTWTTVNATVTLPAGTQILTVSQDSGGYNFNYFAFTSGGTAPAAPTGLTATAGNAQVSLSWAASSGATSYNVYRGTSAGGEGSTPAATGITSTSYTNTGLTNGTAYYFKVAAVNGVGASAQSVEVSATPSSTSSGPIANGTYTLTPQNATGSRVDASGGGTTNGTAVQIWQAAGNANQKWVFTNMGGNIYKIQPSYDTALCMDVNGGNSANGTAVDLWADNGSNAQRWAATAATGGYTFTPQCATGSTLNVSGPSSANGTKLQIWQATGGSNTIFALGTS